MTIGELKRQISDLPDDMVITERDSEYGDPDWEWVVIEGNTAVLTEYDDPSRDGRPWVQTKPYKYPDSWPKPYDGPNEPGFVQDENDPRIWYKVQK